MQGEPSVANADKSMSKWKKLDLAYITLVMAVVLAVTYAVKVSRRNSALQGQVAAQQLLLLKSEGTLSGPPGALSGDIVPAFKTTDLQGRPAEVTYDGTKKSLLFIFSPGCGSCEHGLPLWNSLAPIAASKKFAVRGISIDALEHSKKLLADKEVSFEVLIMPDMTTRRAYRVISIPEVMIVSEHGAVEWVHYGGLDQNKVNELHAKLTGTDTQQLRLPTGGQ